MPKEEWGVKRVCTKTGKRFYDLNKNPIVSPYTGEIVEVETGKASRSLTADKPDKAKPEAAKDEEEVLVDDADDLLGDDADDISVDDDLLEDDDDDDTVALDDLADVAAEGDDDT